MSRSHNRYLCPVCLDLQEIKAPSEQTPGIIVLVCGHERPYALLPSNGVSVEQLDSPAGKRLFPEVTFVPSTAPNNADAEGVDADATEEEDEEETHAA